MEQVKSNIEDFVIVYPVFGKVFHHILKILNRNVSVYSQQHINEFTMGGVLSSDYLVVDAFRKYQAFKDPHEAWEALKECVAPCELIYPGNILVAYRN